MHRSSSIWFGSPKEELSAVERAHLSAKRETRLEQHMLAGRPYPATAPRGLREPRDPLDLHRGVDVQILAESAFDQLFPDADI